MVTTTAKPHTGLHAGNRLSTDVAQSARTHVGYIAYLLAANEPVFDRIAPLARVVVPRLALPSAGDAHASPICFVEVDCVQSITTAGSDVPGDEDVRMADAATQGDAPVVCEIPAAPPQPGVMAAASTAADTLIDAIRAISNDLSRSLLRFTPR